MTAPLVRLCWWDAAFEMDTAPKLAFAETVGWLTHDGDDIVTVAGERIDDTMYRCYTTVPRCCVVELTPL